MWQKERLERIMFDWSVKPKIHLITPKCLHVFTLINSSMKYNSPPCRWRGTGLLLVSALLPVAQCAPVGFFNCMFPKRHELVFLRTGFGSRSYHKLMSLYCFRIKQTLWLRSCKDLCTCLILYSGTNLTGFSGTTSNL